MTSIALYVIQYGTIGGCNAHEICFQLHKSSALWDMKNILVIDNVDMKNILVIDRERGGTLVMYVLQNVGRRKGRRCALCVSARSTAPELVRQPIEHQSAHTGH